MVATCRTVVAFGAPSREKRRGEDRRGDEREGRGDRTEERIKLPPQIGFTMALELEQPHKRIIWLASVFNQAHGLTEGAGCAASQTISRPGYRKLFGFGFCGVHCKDFRWKVEMFR